MQVCCILPLVKACCVEAHQYGTVLLHHCRRCTRPTQCATVIMSRSRELDTRRHRITRPRQPGISQSQSYLCSVFNFINNLHLSSFMYNWLFSYSCARRLWMLWVWGFLHIWDVSFSFCGCQKSSRTRQNCSGVISAGMMLLPTLGNVAKAPKAVWDLYLENSSI